MPGIGARRKKRTPKGRERYNERVRQLSSLRNTSSNAPATPPESNVASRVNLPTTPGTSRLNRQLFADNEENRRGPSRGLNFDDLDSCEREHGGKEFDSTSIVNSMANLLELTLEETADKRKAALDLLSRYPLNDGMADNTQSPTTPATVNTSTPCTNSIRFRSPLANLVSKNSVAATPWNPQAFYRKRNGELRVNAPRTAKAVKTQAAMRIQSTVDQIGTAEQKLLALEAYLKRPRNTELSKGLLLRVLSENGTVGSFCIDQLIGMIQNARKKRTNDSETFLRTVFMAIAPDIAADGKARFPLSLNKTAKLFGVPQSSFKRRMSQAVRARKKLLDGEDNSRFVVKYRRSQMTIYTMEWIRSLHHFILQQSNNVVRSPNMNHTVKVKDPFTGETTHEQKCYYRHSIRELHNEILEKFDGAKTTDGRIVLGETTLRRLLPKQLSRLTESQKATCGCEGCLVPKAMTTCLNAFRTNLLTHLKDRAAKAPAGAVQIKRQQVLQQYEQEAFPNGKRRWDTAHDVIDSMTCARVNDHNVHKTECALGRCKECPPLFIPEQERGTSELFDRRISFHVYKVHHRCTKHGPMYIVRQEVPVSGDVQKKPAAGRKKHELVCTACQQLTNDPSFDPKKKTKLLGKITSKKWLTLRREPIGIFLKKFFIPEMIDYRYHCHLVAILGKHHCGDARKERYSNVQGAVLTQRDYADHLEAEFNNAIQSEHFGDSITVSMEGCTVRFKDATDNGAHKMHYYACVSDDKRQDARTTFLNTETIVTALREDAGRGLLQPRKSTLFELMDGCTKQYRSGNALYLMALIASKLELTLDRMIQAPGHGKGECDSQGGVDKTWVKQFFLTIFSAERTEEEMKKQGRYGIDAHVITVDGKRVSFAQLVVAVLSDPRRVTGLKGSGKYAKREREAAISLRRYFAMHHDGNTDSEANSIVPLINTTFRCNDNDFPTNKGEKYNGLMGHYHVLASYKLGIGTVAVRRFPCACAACFHQLQSDWVFNVPAADQPMFRNVDNCAYSHVFGKHNSWKIVRLQKDKKEHDDEEIRSAYQDVLEGIDKRTFIDIEKGNYGAYQNDVKSTGGYYLIRFEEGAFALQEDSEVEGCGIMKQGTMVCRAVYWNPVPSAKKWFTPPTVITASHKKLFRVRYVAHSHVALIPISNSNKLPNGLTSALKKRSEKLGAMKVTIESHDEITAEIARRAMLDYYEGDNLDDEEYNSEDDDDSGLSNGSTNDDDTDEDDSDVEIIPAPKRRKFEENDNV